MFFKNIKILLNKFKYNLFYLLNFIIKNNKKNEFNFLDLENSSELNNNWNQYIIIDYEYYQN